MKAKLDAGRSLLYATSRYVDVYKILEDIERERKLSNGKLTPEERAECKTFSKLADAFTPLAKGMIITYYTESKQKSRLNPETKQFEKIPNEFEQWFKWYQIKELPPKEIE